MLRDFSPCTETVLWGGFGIIYRAAHATSLFERNKNYFIITKLKKEGCELQLRLWPEALLHPDYNVHYK